MQLQTGETVLAQQPTALYSQYGRPSGLLVLTNVRLSFEMYSGGYLLPSVEVGLDRVLNAFPMAAQGDLIIDSKTLLTVDTVQGRMQFDLLNAAQWAQMILQARASVPPPPPPPPPPPA
jgi:hypothetical protein